MGGRGRPDIAGEKGDCFDTGCIAGSRCLRSNFVRAFGWGNSTCFDSFDREVGLCSSCSALINFNSKLNQSVVS